jgi:hypothetical protein
MKTKRTNENLATEGVRGTLGHACRECGQKVLAQIRETKAAILAEARETLKGQEQILRLALNEAEALAWQTLYPHLVFAGLATEKIQKVASWDSRQRSLGERVRFTTF